MLFFVLQRVIIYLKKILNRYMMRMNIGDTLKVLSDPVRREILQLLKKERMTAGSIAEAVNMTPAALSYHLKLLKNADFVLEYKEKNFIWYEINTSVFDEIIMWMQQFGGNVNEKQ